MRILYFILSCLLISFFGNGCDNNADPPWCKAEGTPDTTCDGPFCVAGVIIDYKRLEPRGYRIFALNGTSVKNSLEAEEIAKTYVIKEHKAKQPDFSDSDKAGDFYNCWLSYANKNTWFVIVHAPTSQVVFAGLEIWANPDRNRDFPLPENWQNSVVLGCTEMIPDPAHIALVTTGIPIGTEPASTSKEALSIARQLNLSQQFIAGRSYSAMVVSHSPATGEFDPQAADWFVWLSPIE